jgi:hypothetical protein
MLEIFDFKVKSKENEKKDKNDDQIDDLYKVKIKNYQINKECRQKCPKYQI